ncbi:MAG: sigma 54-interacting transcriptional regulator [Eubacteriales bacterium]|nr:sigma 54-interacting transcriptional regulator [Eubacteriales bacterium]
MTEIKKEGTSRLEKVEKTLSDQVFGVEDLGMILDCSKDGIWITDGEGKVIYVNDTNASMIGVSKKDLIGKSCAELIEEKIFQSSAVMEVIKTKKAVSMMGYNYKTKLHVAIAATPILDEKGNIKYIVNNVRNLTEIKKLMSDMRMKDQIIHEQRQEMDALLNVNNAKKGRSKDIVVASKKMELLMERVERVSRFDSTVLILGESGAGKEVIAREVVREGKRAGKAFIKVNCGAIPENLLESELFGYEKGAFTGADRNGKMGMFELADKGTIFLDEVAELPMHLQVKLLRVLQEMEIVRVGGTKPIQLDVRVIAATNRDLDKMVMEETFRKDLYYRLNVVTLEVPPLRERREEIPQLINVFTDNFCKKHQIERVFTGDTILAMMDYDWPGNIRELQNIVENLIIMSDGEKIDVAALPRQFMKEEETTQAVEPLELDDDLNLKDALQRAEQQIITRAMEKYKNTRAAAEALGVNQSTIVRKMKLFK